MSIASMPNFEYCVPETVEEVLKLLDTYGDEAKVIAGGTDLIPKMKGGVMVPKYVISLKNVRGLKYIDYDGTQGLRFGAATPLRVVERHPVVAAKYKALQEGIHSMASTQIRNAGTVAGNICNAVPSADTAPPLLVLEAKVKIESISKSRVVPIEDFFTGVCRTVVEPNELVTEILLPKTEEHSNSIYLKYSIRKALDLAMVGVAAKVTVNNGVCEDVKIGLGAVGITPARAYEGEAMLIGQSLTRDLIDTVSSHVSENECSPITDMRATREYRREIVRVLVRDAILQTIGQ